jgi:hypothetical protein
LLLTFLFGFDILISAWYIAKALGLFACSFSSTNVILLCTTCQTYNSFYHYSYSFKKHHAECFSRFLNLFNSFILFSFLATKSQEAWLLLFLLFHSFWTAGSPRPSDSCYIYIFFSSSRKHSRLALLFIFLFLFFF